VGNVVVPDGMRNLMPQMVMMVMTLG